MYLDRAVITMQDLPSVWSEDNGTIEVCAEISGLPSGGLGVDITITLDVTDITTGI